MKLQISGMLCAAVLSSSLFGAAPPKEERASDKKQPANATTKATDQHAERQTNDHMLASCVAIENQAEVAIAKFAEEKTENSDVRAFAQMLVKDHSTFLEKLKQFAPEAAEEGFLNQDIKERAAATREQPQTNAQTATKSNAVVQRTAKPALDGQSEQPIDQMLLGIEMAQQCLSDTKAMLTEKSEHFDECFVGLQIAKHADMKSKLTVLERHASGELAELFATAIKTTESHMTHAEELMEKLAKDNKTTAASK